MVDPRVLVLLPFVAKSALILPVIRSLVERGVDVVVVSCSKGGNYTEDSLDDFRSRDRFIDLSDIGVESKLDKLEESIRRFNINVVLQVGAYSLYEYIPRLRERFQGVGFCDMLYNEVGHTLNHFLFERAFDGVIVESDYMRKFVFESSLKRDPWVQLVRSGVDLQYWKPKPFVEKDFNLERPMRIGYVGRLSPEKNPIGFIDLCEGVDRLLPPDAYVEFQIIGQGPQASDVTARVQASPARKRLRFDGYVPDLRSALLALDVIVVPSRLDGRPVTIMEANACGVPVLASGVGGIPEMIEQGLNGMLIGPNNAAAFVEIISHWIAEPNTLLEIKRSSRQVAESKFDAARMYDEYHAAIAQVAARARQMR